MVFSRMVVVGEAVRGGERESGQRAKEQNTESPLKSSLEWVKLPPRGTLVTVANSEWAPLLSTLPTMLTFSALSHWADEQAEDCVKLGLGFFLWPLYLCFLHLRLGLRLCKHPPPPTLSPTVTLVQMNTWNPAFLWKHWVGQR